MQQVVLAGRMETEKNDVDDVVQQKSNCLISKQEIQMQVVDVNDNTNVPLYE